MTQTTDERAAGRAEAYARIGAIINAESLQGHTARLHSALNLAIESPDMSADAVVKFVTAHVAEGKSGLSLAGREHPANALGHMPVAASGDDVKVAGIVANYRGTTGLKQSNA